MKLNNFILVFIFLIVGMNAVYSAPVCWNEIVCNQNMIPSGIIISPNYTEENSIKEEMCVINGINVDIYRQIEIEIIQGQFEGGVKSIKIFVDQEFITHSDQIYFLLSKATSPTYVLCHQVAPSSGATENLVRIGTRRYWTASYDQQWFKQNAGIAGYGGYENLKNWNENKTYNNPDKNVLNTSQKGTQATTYENLKSDTTNWFFYGFSLFMFIIGLLLIFTTVIEYSKRR